MAGNAQILASSLHMLENRFCARVAASFVSPLTAISKLSHRLPMLLVLTWLVIHRFSEGQKKKKHFTSHWFTTVFNLSCFLDNLMIVPFCKRSLNDGLRSVLDFTWIKF